jgi:hypothetical protein
MSSGERKVSVIEILYNEIMIFIFGNKPIVYVDFAIEMVRIA